MHIAVDVRAGTVKTIEERAGGLPPIVTEFPVTMPPVPEGCVRVGWNDDEPHVEAIELEDGDEGERAKTVQRGKGMMTFADGEGLRNEVILDRAAVEPFLAVLDAARVAYEAKQMAEAAAGTTVRIVPPPGFTR